MWSLIRRHIKTVELPQSDGSNRIIWKKLSISDFAGQMEVELAERRAARPYTASTHRRALKKDR